MVNKSTKIKQNTPCQYVIHTLRHLDQAVSLINVLPLFNSEADRQTHNHTVLSIFKIKHPVQAPAPKNQTKR